MKWTCIFILLLLAGGAASAQISADTIRTIDLLFRNMNDTTPGCAIAISRDGQMIYNKAFGMADLEHDIKNTTSTIFESGSVAKQFTATAVLLLAEEGKLSLEDDVRKYIPELADYGNVIRIKNLLTHTSGIKDWRNLVARMGWPTGTKVYGQREALGIIFNQKSLDFIPGEKYAYSNSNFNLLVTIIERVSHEVFAAFTQRRLFDRVGMTHTRWRDNFRTIVKDRAFGYSKGPSGFLLDMPFENGHGPGGLLTTTGDLTRWNNYWASGGFGDKLMAMHTQHGILNNGTVIDYTTGAVSIGKYNSYEQISHSGATAGYRSWLAYYPAKHLSILYISNDGSIAPGSIGKKLADIFLRHE